jgi:D-3-phosphoglycerate dehydrogenase
MIAVTHGLLALDPQRERAMAAPLVIGLTGDILGIDGKPRVWNTGLDQIDATAGRVIYRVLEQFPPELTPAHVRDVDGIVVSLSKVTQATFAGSDRLKVLARFGVGVDNVDITACTEAGVILTITDGAVSTPVAEGIVCYLLALSHNLLIKDRLVRGNRWREKNRYPGTELRDRVVGFVGLGRIARRALQLLVGFRMAQSIAFDPHVDEISMAQLGVRKVSLPELLHTADFVVISCALTPETRGLIGADQLALMRPGAYLVNVARGAVIDQAALVRHLADGRIAGAGLDVFTQEPTDGTLPFISMENVILSPHAIAMTQECIRDMGRMAIRSILDVFEGRRPHGLFNPEVFGRPNFRARNFATPATGSAAS